MDIQLLEKRFALMGARVKVSEMPANNRRIREGIDIRTDSCGEFFDIKIASDGNVSYEVVDLHSDMRHLLLMARRDERKEKFLCGHDERHWFVCAVPGQTVANVTDAMIALQPRPIRQHVERVVKRHKNRLLRRNEAFKRQGEWFFVPVSDLIANPKLIHRNEPISRGGGSKPHVCEELYRAGGIPVMVCSRYPAGLLLGQYENFLKANAKAKNWDWRLTQRGAAVYVRGRVRHNDHQTIVLDGWHQVLMNTENEAPGARNVVFLD